MGSGDHASPDLDLNCGARTPTTMHRDSPTRAPCAAAVLLALAAAAAAQTPSLAVAPGYDASARYTEGSSPLAMTGFAVDARQTLFVAVHNCVMSIDASDNVTLLQQLPLGHDVGLIAVPDAGDELLLSDFQAALLWRHDLISGAVRAQPLPHQAFDLARAGDGSLLVSANPRWPAPGAHSGVWLLDAGGNHREIVQLLGPSGPLVFDARGDLYYGLQSAVYPTPPGSVRVLRFAAADVRRAIAGGAPLQIGDASVALDRLDGAFDLAFDDRGRLYGSDPQRGVWRTSPDGRLEASPFVAPPPPPAQLGALQLQFADRGATTFDAFQPGVERLYVHASDWRFTSAVHVVVPQRPALSSSPPDVVPPGPLAVRLDRAPAGALAALFVSAAGASYDRAILELAGTPLWFALDTALPLVCLPRTADTGGSATWPLLHAGGFGAALHLQAIALAPALPLTFGSSTLLTLILQP